MAGNRYVVHYHHCKGQNFNDRGHLQNFFKYLFRVDKAQKWTNDYSPFNCYIFQSGAEFVLQSCLSNGEREALKNKLFKETLQSCDKEIDKLMNDILYLDLEKDKVELEMEDLVTIFKEGMEYYHEYHDVKTSCLFVLHVDQGEPYHIHRVYYE